MDNWFDYNRMYFKYWFGLIDLQEMRKEIVNKRYVFKSKRIGCSICHKSFRT